MSAQRQQPPTISWYPLITRGSFPLTEWVDSTVHSNIITRKVLSEVFQGVEALAVTGDCLARVALFTANPRKLHPGKRRTGYLPLIIDTQPKPTWVNRWRCTRIRHLFHHREHCSAVVESSTTSILPKVDLTIAGFKPAHSFFLLSIIVHIHTMKSKKVEASGSERWISHLYFYVFIVVWSRRFTEPGRHPRSPIRLPSFASINFTDLRFECTLRDQQRFCPCGESCL